MASSTISAEERIELVVRRVLSHMFAPMPARVISVKSTTRTTVEILPLFNAPRQNRDTKDVTNTPSAAIPEVPVLVPASSGSDCYISLAAGDVGLYIPTMWSLDNLQDTDNDDPIDVQDPNQQPYDSGFFIPMRWNRTLPSGATAGKRVILGNDVRLGDDPTGSKELAYTQSVQSLGDVLEFELGEISAAIGLLGGAYTPGAVPTIQGTSDLRAS